MNKIDKEIVLKFIKMPVYAALILSAAPVVASELEAITFEPGSEDNFQVRMSLDDTSGVQPEIYVIEQPARIVLDLPGVQNDVSQKQYPLTLSNARDAVLLGTDDRTRLVLNLNTAAAYEYELQGNDLVLMVGNSSNIPVENSVQAPTTAVTQTNSSASSGPVFTDSNVAGLIDFEFRRGADGEGNLMLQFDTDRVNADINQSGSRINLSFFDADVDDSLLRIFDVQDFATPVGTVSVRQLGSEAIVEIKTINDYDYLAYQADNSYVVSVKPLTPEQEAERAREFAYVGEKLSLNFQDIPVRSVLQLIADFTDLNLVASDTVTGNITLRLQNVPWDQALDIVLKTKGLDKRQEGNILLVAPLAEIAERERLEVEANKQLEELAPLITQFIRIRYADAADIFDLLSAQSSVGGASGGGESGGGDAGNENLISDRGSAVVDERTNTIILTDTEEKVNGFIAIVNQLDVPIRQVLIEARIVAANTDFRRELGVRWGGMGVRTVGNDPGFSFMGSREALTGNGGTLLPIFNGTGDVLLDDTLAVDLGVANATSSFGVSFLSDSAFVDLELSALQAEGHGEIVSQPKIVTGDKQTAEIKAGQEIAYQEAASSGATTTSFREAVLSLEVTPQITPDNRIILDIVLNQDSLGDLVFGGEPVIDVNQITTQVLVDNGETLVLGGIFQTNTLNGEDKVPFLGDIPFIGRAFKNTIVSEEKQEVLFFITPKILADTLDVR